METLNKINSFVWGTPTLLLIFFTGVILTLRTNFFQLRFFKSSIKAFFGGNKVRGDGKRLSPMQSASTALSATMGTGNIVGVAGAVALGGPGAVFWMWVSSLFCMIVKFAEIALAVRYRETARDGSYMGGAMYYIKNALPRFFAPLGVVFCICGTVAAFGTGNMTQINTMSQSISQMVKAVIDISPRGDFLIKLATGLICAILCGYVLKNDGRIGSFCEKVIPVMTVLYIGITVGAIAFNYTKIPSVFAQIFVGAFSPKGVTGGVIGSAFVGMRFGMSRGVFSNEAGLGTAPTAYACSDGDEVSLGLMGIMEVFIDTVVVCTLTALTLLCAGDITYGVDMASSLTLNALTQVYGKNIIFIFCPVVCFFAFSSVIGWGLYGAKFVTFLLGDKAQKPFLFLFVAAMVPAAVFRADAVWVIAEILNGLMALPNITALLFLTNEIADITYSYKRKLQGK
ncbi:MAG: sodium:alanine symporter family protein [Clostridia bacterium]|nr:sodium:alanine symporter family protein [Clostridia bacterium]